MSNEELIKRYLSIRENNLTEKTIQAYEVEFNTFMVFLGSRHFSEVDHKVIDDYLYYCKDKRNNGDKALARKHNSLSKFYEVMIKREYLDMKNPFDKVERVKTRKKLADHLTIEDYNKIMNYLNEQENYRDLAIFSLLMSSGIRRAEIQSLNINDIDLENCKINRIIGKGNKMRHSMFSREAKIYLEKYLDSRTDNNEALFVTAHGRISLTMINRITVKAGKEAGVRMRVTPHKLRHGCAMMLYENGLRLDEIQQLLGHASVSTTQIYAQNSLNKVRSKIEHVYDNKLKRK